MRKQNENSFSESSEMSVEQECRDLEGVLKIFRESRHSAAARSEFFWKKQHDSIIANLSAREPFRKLRPVLLWAPAAAAILFCLIFFSLDSNPIIPDIVAGYDQDLLIEVDRALSRDCPAAMEQIGFLAGEIEREAGP